MSKKTEQPPKIRVIIADDHPVLRNGVVNALKSVKIIQKVTEASDGNEVLANLANEEYEVVLMDIKMSPMDGIQATKIIHQRYPTVKVIALTNYDDLSFVLTLLQNGASGYLLKTAEQDEIATAIENVMEGRNYYSTEIALNLNQSVDRFMKKAFENESLNKVNPIYRDIIYLVCKEYSNKQIAGILNKSKRTIDTYRREIIRLTNSNNSLGLYDYAIKHGILDDLNLQAKFQHLFKK